MRERHNARALGLVLGAGVSKAVNFPSWSELVKRIASDPDVNGSHLFAAASSTTSDTAKTQMLLQHYLTKKLDALGEPVSAKTLRKIHGEWRQIIQRALYQGVLQTATELRDRHSYLKEYVPLITKSPMTVTYNFDDMLERLVRLADADREGRFGRSFETVWNAALQFRPDTAVIYHPRVRTQSTPERCDSGEDDG